MIQHYKDLIKLYWLRILVGAAVSGVLACAVALLLLKTSPTYKATVTFNMQPSEEALSFNRQFLGVSQFNPATIITETHIERLLSRPIQERTLDKLLEQNPTDTPPIGPTFFSNFKLGLWKTWTRLNYGEYRPLQERAQLLNDLAEALTVEPVEGSYILLLEASYKYPAVAAQIANTHAQSYIEAASEEFQAQLDERVIVLQRRIDAEEKLLAALFEERERMRREFDVANLSRESELLIASLQNLRRDLEEDQLSRSLRQNEIANVTSQNSARSSGTISDLQDEIDILDQRIAFRQQQIATQSAELSSMSSLQLDFDTLGAEVEEIENTLTSLRAQLLAFELGAQASSSQIQVVSQARVPVYPASPKVFVYTVAATIVGAIMVFMTVILQEMFGARIRTSYDLEQEVGNKALPSLKPNTDTRWFGFLKRSVQQRRISRFAKAFGQQMSLGAGWRSNKIVVTGFVPNETLIDVRNLLGNIVRQSIVIDKDAKPFQVNSIGPIYSIKDWDGLGDCQVVVVLEPNQQTNLDVQGVCKVGRDVEREPLFMLWV